MEGNSTLEEVLRELRKYRERKDIECKECIAKYMKCNELLNNERTMHIDTKNKLKDVLKEFVEIKNKLKEANKNDLVQMRLKSQLLAYQILHKKDVEHEQEIKKELSKVKTELLEINEKYQQLISENKQICDINKKVIEELNLENEKLRAKNKQLIEEFKRIKRNTNDISSQLLVL